MGLGVGVSACLCLSVPVRVSVSVPVFSSCIFIYMHELKRTPTCGGGRSVGGRTKACTPLTKAHTAKACQPPSPAEPAASAEPQVKRALLYFPALLLYFPALLMFAACHAYAACISRKVSSKALLASLRTPSGTLTTPLQVLQVLQGGSAGFS